MLRSLKQKVHILFVLSFILMCSHFAFAIDSTKRVEFEFKKLSTNFFEDIISPVTTKAWIPFLSGSVITAGLLLSEDKFADPLQKKIVTNRSFNSLARFGDYWGRMIPNGLYTLGMLSHGLFAKSEVSKSRAVLMLKSTAYAAGITTGLKYSVREPRPNNGDDKTSFPSGHTTTAFAFASIVGVVHPWYYGLAAYSAATIVAYSRLHDNRHELQDVVAGATIGVSYGLGLYYQSIKHADRISFVDQKLLESSDQPIAHVQILPTENLDGALAALIHEF